MGIRSAVGVAGAGIGVVIVGIYGLLLHLYTILMAFMESGFFAAALTLVFPVLAQAYWLFAIGMKIGFLNTYSVAVAAFVLGWVAVAVFAAMANSD